MVWTLRERTANPTHSWRSTWCRPRTLGTQLTPELRDQSPEAFLSNQPHPSHKTQSWSPKPDLAARMMFPERLRNVWGTSGTDKQHRWLFQTLSTAIPFTFQRSDGQVPWDSLEGRTYLSAQGQASLARKIMHYCQSPATRPKIKTFRQLFLLCQSRLLLRR